TGQTEPAGRHHAFIGGTVAIVIETITLLGAAREAAVLAAIGRRAVDIVEARAARERAATGHAARLRVDHAAAALAVGVHHAHVAVHTGDRRVDARLARR